MQPRNKTRVTGVYLHVRLACALLFLAWLPAAFGQQRSYSFTGHLVFSDGSPVAGAEIEVATVAYKEVTDPVLTDGQGRFAFAGLPAGLYVLSARRNDLGTFRLGETPDSQHVDAVNLNEKVPQPDMVFRIERYATIVGVVRDPAGNPAPNMQVTAARRSWANGKAAMRTSGSATTDDLGRFRIPWVARGRYRVCVTSPQGSVPVPPVGYATFGQSLREAYSGACMPDARSKELLDIAQGQDVELDVALSPQTLVTVSGKVANAPDVQGFMLQLQPSEPSSGPRTFYGLAARDTHAFQIANVPPGRYWLTAQTFLTGNGVETPLAARVPVTVGDSPVGDVELTLAPSPAIDVVVHAPGDAGEVTVGLRDADDPLGVPTNAQRQADGALRIALQHGGRYWLAVRTPLCPSAARLGKAEALYHPLEIAPGMKETLDVTITHACGDIRAMAVDGAGKPVPKARMLILMSGTPDDPGDYDLEPAGEDGAVSYIGMTPGKYPIWAWSDADDWNGAIDDLASLKARQTVVEVGPGQKADARVPLLSASGEAGK